MVGHIQIKWYNKHMIFRLLQKWFNFTDEEIEDIKKRFYEYY